MMAATQRAQRLARQQMEFVAAVSHELSTPLAAILSAGQNLAAGVVAEPVQVKRYGELIEREGRRLSAMVGQVLDFAGLKRAGSVYTLQATEVGPSSTPPSTTAAACSPSGRRGWSATWRPTCRPSTPTRPPSARRCTT